MELILLIYYTSMNIFLSHPISGTDLKDETVVPNGTWDQKGTVKEFIPLMTCLQGNVVAQKEQNPP